MKLNENASPSISCIMPAYNEARHLATYVPEVLQALQALSSHVELVVVDDGSKDDTAQVMQTLCSVNPSVVYLQLSRNFGKEAALTAGLDAVTGDVVVLMDADGQHPAHLIAVMLKHWREGADVVYAVRKTRDDQTAIHARMVDMFYKLVNLGARVQIPANAGDFRLMDRRVTDQLKTLPERNRFMKGLYAWVGFHATAIDYEPMERAQGASHFRLRPLLSLAMRGVVAFSSAPLRALSVLGLVISLGAIAFGCWAIFEYFVLGNRVPGYATIVVGMMFLSGVQIMSIGVLAEYVGRIYEEVKQRPVYLLRGRVGKGLLQGETGRVPQHPAIETDDAPR